MGSRPPPCTPKYVKTLLLTLEPTDDHSHTVNQERVWGYGVPKKGNGDPTEDNGGFIGPKTPQINPNPPPITTQPLSLHHSPLYSPKA